MLGAIILTGGPSTRMGADKADLVWGSRRAVDWVHDLAMACGATQVVTVGARTYGYPFVPDGAPHPGPVAGVLAGAAALRAKGVDRLLVLAVDAPTITPDDLAPLLAASGGAAYEGLHVPFVATLADLTPDADPDWPLARLVERSGLERRPAPTDAWLRLRGANTPEERAGLLLALKS